MLGIFWFLPIAVKVPKILWILICWQWESYRQFNKEIIRFIPLLSLILFIQNIITSDSVTTKTQFSITYYKYILLVDVPDYINMYKVNIRGIKQ